MFARERNPLPTEVFGQRESEVHCLSFRSEHPKEGLCDDPKDRLLTVSETLLSGKLLRTAVWRALI